MYFYVLFTYFHVYLYSNLLLSVRLLDTLFDIINLTLLTFYNIKKNTAGYPMNLLLGIHRFDNIHVFSRNARPYASVVAVRMTLNCCPHSSPTNTWTPTTVDVRYRTLKYPIIDDAIFNFHIHVVSFLDTGVSLALSRCFVLKWTITSVRQQRLVVLWLVLQQKDLGGPIS